jgi:signal transduction histidine kinase
MDLATPHGQRSARMQRLTSLTNRIFLASAALAVLCIVFAIYLVNVRVTQQSEAELQRRLVEAGALVEQHRALLFENFTLAARLIADLPKLKASVATQHGPTVLPLARDYHAQARSDLFVVTGRDGQVLAEIGSDAAVRIAVMPGVPEGLAGRESRGFWPHPSGLLQVVTVPIVIGATPPEVLGTLSMGFLLSDRLARQFKELTESEIAFAAGEGILASTLPRAHDAQLAAVVGRAGISRVHLDDEEYIALGAPLGPLAEPNGAAPRPARLAGTPAGTGGPTALILRSHTERLRFLKPLHTALGFTAALAVLLATILSYAVARTVTRPLAAITAGMREVGATGDLTRKLEVPSGRWVDEDARLLAHTFNTLIDSIRRFQREAAERERLSSLGRLSTVIAHEVRNPLMIIKASLRTLRRQPPATEAGSEAIEDIEAEVARLNGIVGDVLDFARPIPFELAPADANAICADAAEAASAAGQAPDVTLALSPVLPPILTDGGRLRQALVNIVSNARYAVAARREAAAGRVGAEQDDGHAIEVVTAASGADRIAITVRDQGTGIGPEERQRIFEPYFTTRRGGTGLGLPLAKNIIDCLGGSISVADRNGGGTEIRIELPVEGPTDAARSRER